MPIYEYGCKKCGHEWEKMQGISDPAPKSCPACKSRRVEKLLSLSAFSLKGGGWYADGYASQKGESNKKESGEKSTKKDGSSKSAETSNKKKDGAKASKKTKSTSAS